MGEEAGEGGRDQIVKGHILQANIKRAWNLPLNDDNVKGLQKLFVARW